MKLKLRWCSKCDRETIQARVKRWDRTDPYSWWRYEKYIQGWYCPQCGTLWVEDKVEGAK